MLCIHRIIFAASMALLGAIPASAETPATTQEDPALIRAAYSALQRTPELSDLNIGVRVLKGGTVILWGTAKPTDSAKAEAVLKKVPGITFVINTCDPVVAADPLIARVEAAFKGRPPETAKVEAPKPADLPAAVSLRTTEKRDEAYVIPVALLGDPTPIPKPLDYTGIQRVRQSNPRFSRLTFDLRDGRIVIAASASDPTAAWDMAKLITPFVGDRDVVVARAK